MAHTDLHAATEKRAYGQKKTAPAKTYPTEIAKPTTPDETQETEEQPKFQTWYKGYLTKSEIYERKLPDGLTGALRIDGPDENAISLTSDGSLKIMTGKRNTEKGAGSGKLCIKTWGLQEKHHERADIQYNYGSDEEKQAVNILAYGDYVETTKGGTRYINATKILISASSELVLEGQSIKIQSEGDIEMSATAINTAQINKKDTVTGEKKTSGAGVEVSEKFDPRSNTVWNSPGSVQWNIAQDYQQIVGGCLHQSSVGGAGTLIKSRTFGYYAGSTTNAALAGTTAAGIYSSGEMDLVATSDVVAIGADFSVTTANLNVDAAAVDIVGSGDVSITSAGNVRITGALIFLN